MGSPLPEIPISEVSSSSGVCFSKEDVWQAGQEQGLETGAWVGSCDFWLHNASLVTAAVPGTACSCASQLGVRQGGCSHWGIPLSSPRERAASRGGKQAGLEHTEGFEGSWLQPCSRFLATIILMTSLVPSRIWCTLMSRTNCCTA